MNEERIDEINESHIGREVKGAVALDFVRIVAVDKGQVWVELEGWHTTFISKGPWILKALKPLPTPKKLPSDRIGEIFTSMPDAGHLGRNLIKATIRYLDEMAEKE